MATKVVDLAIVDFFKILFTKKAMLKTKIQRSALLIIWPSRIRLPVEDIFFYPNSLPFITSPQVLKCEP